MKNQQTLLFGNKLVFSEQQLVYFALWFIIPFASFTSHTIFLVPPTLILLLLGIILLLSISTKVSFSNYLILPTICILYFFSTQVIINAPFGRYMGVIFAIVYYLVVLAYGYRIPQDKLKLMISWFISLSTVILLVECIWRLNHPATEYAVFEKLNDVRWIYQYKFSGLMYVDSNAVGIHILIILFFVYYLEAEHDEKLPKTKILLIVLLVLTFSRGAWAGAFLGWIYVSFLRKKRLEFYIINALLLLVLLFLFYKFYLIEKIESDLSFQSKLELIGIVSKYFSDASLTEFFFGVGFSNSGAKLGIYAHNFFMVYCIESGIIGLLLIIGLLIQFVLSTNKSALIIIIPFLITTLSSTITFVPFLYVTMALIFLLERWKRVKINSHEN